MLYFFKFFFEKAKEFINKELTSTRRTIDYIYYTPKFQHRIAPNTYKNKTTTNSTAGET